jgi:hypothetical protein
MRNKQTRSIYVCIAYLLNVAVTSWDEIILGEGLYKNYITNKRLIVTQLAKKFVFFSGTRKIYHPLQNIPSLDPTLSRLNIVHTHTHTHTHIM